MIGYCIQGAQFFLQLGLAGRLQCGGVALTLIFFSFVFWANLSKCGILHEKMPFGLRNVLVCVLSATLLYRGPALVLQR